jgi:hypothetical protein
MNKILIVTVLVLACSASSHALLFGLFNLLFGHKKPAPTPVIVVPNRIPIYRYCNGQNYYYTNNWNDIGTNFIGRVGARGFRCEGIGYYAYASQYQNSVPFHRYSRGGDYYYSHDINEYGRDASYKYEGIVGWIFRNSIAGGRRFYRLRHRSNPRRYYWTVNLGDSVCSQYNVVDSGSYVF